MDEDPDISPRQSTRSKAQHDYAMLNDLFLVFYPAPELAALACKAIILCHRMS